MEPITWDLVTTEREKAIREWEAVKASQQENLARLRRYLELPSRDILYQIDDAVRTALVKEVRKNCHVDCNSIQLRLAAPWTPPPPPTPWLNPWPTGHIMVERFCSLPAYESLRSHALMTQWPQYEAWYTECISEMIADVWREWIYKEFPNTSRICVSWESWNNRGNSFVADLIYSIDITITAPPSIGLYEPLLNG
jgi:hypothetical protein